MLIACAFAIAAVTIAPTVFDEPDRFDEGFVASGAMMVLRGWLPIRDLFVIYGPGQRIAEPPLQRLRTHTDLA